MSFGGIDVRMNYDTMESMAKAFKAASTQLQNSKREMEKLAKSMEDGALQGDAGKRFAEAIRQDLNKAIDQLDAKMQQLEQDINGAVQAKREGVATAKGRFNF